VAPFAAGAVAGVRHLQARNLVSANVDLDAYTVASSTGSNDGTLNVENDEVFLIGQTTVAENGLYTVGPVSGGAAALTRSKQLPEGTVFVANSLHVHLTGGTFYKQSLWKNIAAGTIGTNDPSFKYEECRGRDILVRRARNVINGNVTDLSALTVTADPNLTDNVTVTADSQVLLIAQSTASENGLYNVGAVDGTTAPLTRVPEMRNGTVLLGTQGVNFDIYVGLGDVYQKTKWFLTAAANSVIGTTDPGYFPESLTQTITLASGTRTISNVPIASATKTGVSRPIRVGDGTGRDLTLDYVLNAAPTPGKLGTGSLVIRAALADGTINAADGSTLIVTINNR
jgi:hypothetical protein